MIVYHDTDAFSIETAEWNTTLALAKEEGKVVIAGMGSITSEKTSVVNDILRKKYGIELIGIRTPTGSAMKQLEDEQKKGQCSIDIICGGYAPLGRMIQCNQGATPVNNLKLPELKNKEVWKVDPNQHIFDPDEKSVLIWFPMGAAGGTPAIYNTKLVPDNRVPYSIYDLLDPFWKGKLLMFDITQQNIGSELIALLKLNKKVDLDFWSRMVKEQELAFTSNKLELITKVASGEYLLSVSSAWVSADRLYNEGEPIKPLFFKEGVEIGPFGISVAKKAPHQNAAKVFINWCMSKEGQEVWTKLQRIPSIRKDVPDNSPEYIQIPLEIPLLMINKQASDWVAEALENRSLHRLAAKR